MLKGRVGPSLGGRAGALVPLKQSGGLQSHIYVSSKTVLWASSASPAAPAQVKRPTLTAQAIRPVVFFMDATAVRVPLEPQQVSARQAHGTSRAVVKLSARWCDCITRCLLVLCHPRSSLVWQLGTWSRTQR